MKMHMLGERKPYGYAGFGCMWEKGTIRPGTEFVAGVEGKDTPAEVQTRETAYWPDGSVKWTVHTALTENLGFDINILPAKKHGSEGGIKVSETTEGYAVSAGRLALRIAASGRNIIPCVSWEGKEQICGAEPVLLMEERESDKEILNTRIVPFLGETESCDIEEKGPLKLTFCLKGSHVSAAGRRLFPFELRVGIYYDSPKIDFEHTFFFDGNEATDFMKGIGIRFRRKMGGELYNRHVRMGIDHGSFHEPLILLNPWHPRVPSEIYQAQINGGKLELDPDKDADAAAASKKMPVWSRYELFQDSAAHFVIRKKIYDPGCCFIEGLHGKRAPGSLSVGDEEGGFMLAAKDFWQKYPSGLEAADLDRDMAEIMLWLWSPSAEAMDFRHYADQGYSQTYYEGFDEVGASAFGIANTNNFSISVFNAGERAAADMAKDEGAERGACILPDSAALDSFAEAVQRPPVYIGEPEYYHCLGAFGEWGLISRETEIERLLEEQLDSAFDFYRREADIRSWYGFFNYGDICHTYDPARHCWKYDMGGYAWQNTELVPTLWLWYAFLRSGREDIFTMAEAMTRHCSEVDVYHFGPLKGLGSRHNVRHWGCSCKEARIAMAGHHRFYYYLTGDARLGEVFDEVKDADRSLVNMDPLRFFYDREKMVYPTHARSGPDWSSFCSNWMTAWERRKDEACREKILTGINDLKKAPLKLTSGADFEYDPESAHLRYIGEKTAGGSHLQVCMGAPEVWIETASLLDDDEWKKMLADHGKFYYLSREEQIKISQGLIGDREFTLPFMAAGLASFAAKYLKDEALSRTTWRILLHALFKENNLDGFKETPVKDAADLAEYNEIPWITTNFTAQWCLNVIHALNNIREYLPKTKEELVQLLKGLGDEGFRKA